MQSSSKGSKKGQLAKLNEAMAVQVGVCATIPFVCLRGCPLPMFTLLPLPSCFPPPAFLLLLSPSPLSPSSSSSPALCLRLHCVWQTEELQRKIEENARVHTQLSELQQKYTALRRRFKEAAASVQVPNPRLWWWWLLLLKFVRVFTRTLTNDTFWSFPCLPSTRFVALPPPC